MMILRTNWFGVKAPGPLIESGGLHRFFRVVIGTDVIGTVVANNTSGYKQEGYIRVNRVRLGDDRE
jgi:hypothetical protein